MAQFSAPDGKIELPDPKWGRTRTGGFNRLNDLDPEAAGLKGANGVLVIWHAGVRPRWLYIARSDDLAASFRELGARDDLMSYEANGGIYATWALIRDELQDGVVGFLTKILKPLLPNPDVPGPEVDPVPVQIPRSKAAMDAADKSEAEAD